MLCSNFCRIWQCFASKNANFFADFSAENISKNRNIGSGSPFSSLIAVAEVYNYYRAIVCSGEVSMRALELTK
jgi:hypothetical protein